MIKYYRYLQSLHFHSSVLQHTVAISWHLGTVGTHSGNNDNQHVNRLVGKPTMWFPNRSDTNRAVQPQITARSLKFRI